MFTRIFRDRSVRDRVATEEQALAELLAVRELRSLPLARHCEIGPFVVEYLFPEQSLIVELAATCPGPPTDDSPAARRQVARLRFLNDMGYAVFAIDPRELARQPRRVLARLRTALRS